MDSPCALPSEQLGGMVAARNLDEVYLLETSGDTTTGTTDVELRRLNALAEATGHARYATDLGDFPLGIAVVDSNEAAIAAYTPTDTFNAELVVRLYQTAP